MNEMVGLVEAFAASYPTQPIGHASVAVATQREPANSHGPTMQPA